LSMQGTSAIRRSWLNWLAWPPVAAVRGNVDKGTWAQLVPETEVLEVGGAAFLYVLHKALVQMN
jgi:predicted phosphodiesterase